MRELVHERAVLLHDDDGNFYDRAWVYAEPAPGGTWAGYIEFVAPGGTLTVVSTRETTQSRLADVAYWATGLEPVYFEGALARACRSARDVRRPRVALPGVSVARMEVATVDPELPLRLMRARTVVPGQRRRIRDAGVIVFEGTLRSAREARTGRYLFVVQFGSENTAAVVANTLWTGLRGEVASVTIDGVPVSINHLAFKDALVLAASRRAA